MLLSLGTAIVLLLWQAEQVLKGRICGICEDLHACGSGPSAFMQGKC